MLVLSPHTLIRYRGRRIFVHTSLRRDYLAFDDAHILFLLDWFAKPRQSDSLPQISAMTPAAIRDHVDSLVKIGALVAVSSSSAWEEKEGAPDDGIQNVQRAHTHLCSVANAIYAISNDILAFGPWAETKLSDQTGLGVADRMESILAAVDALRSELCETRTEYLEEQLHALGLASEPSNLQLNIGAGDHSAPGWIGLDVYPAQLALSLAWDLPFPTASVRYVYLSHTLEHLYYPDEALRLLSEIHRVLAPDAVVRIVVPDIGKCIRAYVDNDTEFFKSRRQTWPWWPNFETRLENFLAYAGAGAQPASFFDGHKYGYDIETLTSLLRGAGFTQIAESSYMESVHNTLRIDDGTRVGGAKYRDQYYSLFAEAVR